MRRAVLLACPLLGACSLLDFEALDRKADAAGRDSASDGSVRECERIHTFCEDFDQPGLESRWSIVGNAAGAPLIDGAKFTSPPSSLLTRALVGSAPVATPYLSKTFAAGGTTKIDLALSIGDVTLGATSTLHAVALSLKPPPLGFDDYAFLVNIGGGVTSMVVTAQPSGGAKFYEYKLIDGTLPSWPVRLRVTLDFTASSATFFYQGAVIHTLAIPAVSAIPSLDLTIGVVVDATASDDVRVRFDDVSLDLK